MDEEEPTSRVSAGGKEPFAGHIFNASRDHLGFKGTHRRVQVAEAIYQEPTFFDVNDSADFSGKALQMLDNAGELWARHQ